MKRFNLPYNDTSKNFITKTGYISATIGGIAGLAGTAYYLRNNPDALSTATQRVFVCAAAGVGSGLLLGLIGRDVANSYTPEAKIMSRINGQQDIYHNVRNDVEQSRAHNLTIDDLTRPLEAQNRAGIYNIIGRPDYAWNHLKGVSSRNWIPRLNRLGFEPCSADYRVLTIEQQGHIDRFALECQRHNTTLLAILNARMTPITNWVMETGDTMDEIRKDRLYAQIQRLIQQISNAQQNANDREWERSVNQFLGSESGKNSKDPAKQKQANYNQRERQHEEKREAKDIQNRQTRIDSLCHQYNHLHADPAFNGYFNTHPTSANA